MRWLALLLILFSAEAYAKKCLSVVFVRVDNSFSKKEKLQIEKAAAKWYLASNRKICFGIVYHNIGDESGSHYADDVSTIYNANRGWKRTAARQRLCRYEKNGCMAIAVSHKGKQLGADIFVTKRHRFYPLIIHEIGHLLGLPHSKNSMDVMYDSITKNIRITSRDKKVLGCIMKHNQVADWTNHCDYR